MLLVLTPEYMHLGAYISHVPLEKVHIAVHFGR